MEKLYTVREKKERTGAECDSDHELLIAKFRLKLKNVWKTTRPFRYDVNQSPNDYTVEVTKRWQEYTEKEYKKDLNDPDNHNGVITHLECEVKWALGNITMNKASGGDGIPVELFQILKDDAVKVLHSICSANLENSAVTTELEKVSFHSNP